MREDGRDWDMRSMNVKAMGFERESGIVRCGRVRSKTGSDDTWGVGVWLIKDYDAYKGP